ncbi:MAG: HAD-IIB family hydrolase [Candidatus Kaiserbacteria bacterium]|nr:HAD-IIB family hydrolase [Candidatus Kaiserbacteria bacterium]
MYSHKKHLFFDMDKTVAPARQPILSDMYEFLSSLSHSIIIVSGQEVSKIDWQSNSLPAIRLGQNGNHAVEIDGTELWNIPLEKHHEEEILSHINTLKTLIDHDIRDEWTPIEIRGSQITFSPIGNTAPVDIKMSYDPDRMKRDALIAKAPFISEELIVKIGGSTSFDYIHKDRHKGTNVAKLIEYKGWDKDECVYFGDGLFPGGNDEAVIGVIDTHPVNDHLHTYELLQKYFG